MFLYYIIVISITLTYIFIITLFIIGWYKIKPKKKGQIDPSSLLISVVVAFRNEETNIGHLLNSLSNQTLNKEAFEVVLVNDHSTDNSVIYAQKFLSQIPGLKILHLKDKFGKKEAIKHGIKYARGKLIVTTDADCTLQEGWLVSYAHLYYQSKPKLIIAPVIMQGNNFFEKMQSLDFLSLIVSSAGACGIKEPILCNGANMAFEKEIYLQMNDPHHSKYSSGDDVFLLQKLKNYSRTEILFLKSNDTIVYTNAEKTFPDFLKQRQRWTSKSVGYKDFMLLLTSFTVLLVNFSLLANLLIGISITKFLQLFLLQLMLKSIFDFIFLSISGSYFKQKKLLWYFIPTQLFNVFMIPYIAITGIFTSVKWKERIMSK